MKSYHTPILLRLTSGRLHPLVISLIIIIILVGLLSAIYELEGIAKIWGNYKRSAYSITAMAYIVYISRVIQNAHIKQFNRLLDVCQLSEQAKSDKQDEFLAHRNLWPESIIAVIVGFGHAYLAVLEKLFDQSSQFPFYHTWTGLLIILVWVIITQSISIYMRNMTQMNRLVDHIEIDLLNLDKFMPLTKAGIVSILAFIGAYSILFATGIDFGDITNPAIIALVPTIFVMLHRPLKGVRKRISIAKEDEIERIDLAIDGDLDALKASRIGNNLKNINVIDLINYKKIIQNTLEIPVNIPTASRFLFYLIIPLLTWIAASVVDKLIDFIIK